MQLEDLQNDPVLLFHSALQHLSKRWSLWLLCYTKGRRKGQHLLQFVSPEGPHACLKAPEAVSTSPALRAYSKAFLNVYKTLRWVPSPRSQLCQFPMFLLSPLLKTFLSQCQGFSKHHLLVFLSSQLALASSRVVAKDAILESYNAESK